MINRDTPNNELLVVTKGFYIDYQLMWSHTYKRILHYLDEKFPEENDCWSSSYVQLHSFDYDKTFDRFEIILSSKEPLLMEDLFKFSEEFDVELFKIRIETKPFDRYTSQIGMNMKLSKEDNGELFYIFRKGREWGI